MAVNPMGISAGPLGDAAESNLMNEYATIADVAVEAETDRVDPNQVGTGLTRGIQYLGSTNVYSDGPNSQIIVEDTNDPRVLMGNQPYFGQGLFVSKDGVDAKTNTDANQWIFNSNQNVFKILDTKKLSLTVNAPGGSSAFAQAVALHGLSFVPAFEASIIIPTALAFLSSGGSASQPNPATTFGVVGGVVRLFTITTVTIDATTIYLTTQVDSSTPAGLYNFSATVDLLQKTFS